MKNRFRFFCLVSSVCTLSVLLLFLQRTFNESREVSPSVSSMAEEVGAASVAIAEPENANRVSENPAVRQAAEDRLADPVAALNPGTESLVETLPIPFQTAEHAESRFPVEVLRNLAQNLPSSHRQIWMAFHEEFPELDPTDVSELHRAIGLKRSEFGVRLNDQTRGSWGLWVESVEKMAAELVRLRAEKEGLEMAGVGEDGRAFLLAGFERGEPHYLWTLNIEAAISTNANLVRMNPLFDPTMPGLVSGEGLYVSVNDHGTIFEHPEFQLPDNGGSRIVMTEVNDGGSRSHMTHVAGTVGAWGHNPILKGMAPRVWIRSLIGQSQWHVYRHGMAYPGQRSLVVNPVTGEPEMQSVMGTTSLGAPDNLEYRGLYTSTTRNLDQAFWDTPYYTHFLAAGNAGSSFSTISLSDPVAKNTLTIGAVNDVLRDAEGNFVSGGGLAGFSSRGPTFDGRIKPDFVANGVGVTSPNSMTGHTSLQGTSMATPNASGSAVLVIDYFNRKFPGHFLRSPSVRALLMSTAHELGHSGPDYRFGWGLIDVLAASKVVKRYAANPASRVIVEDDLANGQTWTFAYHSTGEEPVKVSLAWLDPAGMWQSAWSHSPPTRDPRLVNDLDLRVIGPDQTHYPWVKPFTTGQGDTPAFDDTLRNTAAVRGDNVTDNVEQVRIDNPVPGIYTVQVTHKGTLQNNMPQAFSLAIVGMEAQEPLGPSITSVTPAIGTAVPSGSITVEGEGFVVGTDILLRRDGEGEVRAFGVEVQSQKLVGRINTLEITRGYWDVVVRTPDGSEAVVPNAYLLPHAGERITIFEEQFNSGTGGWNFMGNWAIAAPGKGEFGGPEEAFIGNNALVTNPGGLYSPHQTFIAEFPTINTTGFREIQVEFRSWKGLAQTGTVHSAFGSLRYSTVLGSATEAIRFNNRIDEDWQEVLAHLPPSVDNRNQLLLNFTMITSNAPASFGWNIDDIRVTGVNDPILFPPVFETTQADAALELDDTFFYSIAISDADTPAGDLVLTVSGLPAGLNFIDHGNGTATIDGTVQEAGVFPIQISVTDGIYTTHQVFTLFVMPEGGNTPPEIITASPLPDAFLGEIYDAVIEAVDAENHLIELRADSRPGWLGFTDHGDGTATLSGTPPPGSVGTFTVTVTASDGFSTTDKEFDLAVRARAMIAMAESAVSVIESAGTVSLTVLRTVEDAGEVRVDYTTVAGSAQPGSDFIPVSGTLVWADGDMEPKTIVVEIVDDDLPELDESFSVVLSNLSGVADLGSSTTVVTIVDDDVPPGVEIPFSGLHLIDQGSYTASNGVYTLTRTGDPQNEFQGYVLNFDTATLEQVGDFVEVAFRIRANTSNNSGRRMSWGFFNGTPVTGPGQTQLTDAWEGYIHQIGSRNSNGTTQGGTFRQGTGPVGIMDHVGGGNSVNGASQTPSLPSIHQELDVPVSFRIVRMSETHLRVISTYETRHDGGQNSGSGSGIAWNFVSANNVNVFTSQHAIADGPTEWNGFAVASRGNNWVLQDLVVTSNVDVSPPEPTPPQIVNQPQSQSVAEGLTATFSVVAAGHPAPSFQWRKNGADLDQETADTLILPNVTDLDAGNYTVFVSNGVGEGVESAVATLTVTPPPLEEVFLINFTNAIQGTDVAEHSGRTWQRFNLRTATGTGNTPPASFSEVLLRNQSGGQGTGILYSVACSASSGSIIGAFTDQITADMFPPMASGNSPRFDWFDPENADLRQTHSIESNGQRFWTHTFEGFDPADEVRFEFVLRRTATNRRITITFDPGTPDAEVVVNNVNIGDDGDTHYVSHTVSGASSYTFQVGPNSGWSGLINAMAVTVLREAEALTPPHLSGLVMDGNTRGIRIQTHSNLEYLLEYTDTLLDDPVWHPVGDWVTGDGSELELQDDSQGVQQRFYRLRVRNRQ
jgi:hypothetical protein